MVVEPTGIMDGDETQAGMTPSTIKIPVDCRRMLTKEEGWNSGTDSKYRCEAKGSGRGKDVSPTSTSPLLVPVADTEIKRKVGCIGEDGRSSDDSSDDDGDRGMQLGFVERLPEEMQNRLLFQDPDWRDWDGGKVGGKPIWLNPRDLPPQKLLLCPSCQDPLSFVLQIYCPLDEPEEAFHRALYVFVCQKFRCQGPGCVKALRCQLPRQNLFYASDPRDIRKNGGRIKGRAALAVRTCDVCGLRADKVCAGCKRVSYCTHKHQKEGWKTGHKLDCRKVEREKLATEGGGQERGANLTSGGVPASSVNPPQANAPDLGRPADSGVKNALRSTFPEYEIVIEEERVQNDAVRDAREQDADAALLEKYKHVIVSETDDDASLDQQHLNQATGAKLALTDALSLRFLAVIGRYPAQILRYARWDDAAALWVSRDERPASSTDIPSCPLCGARRAFEFQVMPQLLHHLRVDAQVQAPGHLQLGSLDWGTLAVYTCVKSCRTGEKVTGIEEGTGGEEGRYVEEFVWRQKPMA